VDFGENMYDLVILGHICHSEGEEKNPPTPFPCPQRSKGGRKVLIAEMIADDERKKDVFTLMFAANMLLNTNEGILLQ